MIIHYDDSEKEWSNKGGCLDLVIRKDPRGNLNWELNDRKEPDLKNIPGKNKVSTKALKKNSPFKDKKQPVWQEHNESKGCKGSQRSDPITLSATVRSLDFRSHSLSISSLCFNFHSNFSTSVLVTSHQDYNIIITSKVFSLIWPLPTPSHITTVKSNIF